MTTSPPISSSSLSVVTWFNPTADHGVWHLSPQAPGTSWARPSPPLESSNQIAQFIGQPVRYFHRMAPEARHALCAASLALHATRWLNQEDGAPQSSRSVGLLNGRFEGTLASDMAYFQDYLATGRTLARGNLFVYTLPTSVSGAVSAVLGLTGPTIYIHDDRQLLVNLLAQAHRLVESQQADAMLVLWSNQHAAVCLAAGPAGLPENQVRPHRVSWDRSVLPGLLIEQIQAEPDPQELARTLSREVSAR